MSDSNRSRPRRTVTLDPVIDAYLARPEVNAGRLVDNAVEDAVAKHVLIQIAEEEGITTEETDLLGVGVTPEGDE